MTRCVSTPLLVAANAHFQSCQNGERLSGRMSSCSCNEHQRLGFRFDKIINMHANALTMQTGMLCALGRNLYVARNLGFAPVRGDTMRQAAGRSDIIVSLAGGMLACFPKSFAKVTQPWARF